MHFVGKDKEASGAARVVGGHRARFGRLSLVAGLIVLIGAVFLACGQCSRASGEKEAVASSGGQGNALEIGMVCEGWAEENVEVGVFVSGGPPEGEPVDEQVIFRGSSSQTIQLDAGRYEVVPQLPQLMLADGTVLEAGEPITYCLEVSPHETSTTSSAMATVSISYAPADASGMNDEELAAVAATSFLDGEVADRVCARAREKRAL